MSNIGIVGGGKWGSALFFAIKHAGFEPKIWSRTPRDIDGFVSLDEILECEHLIISIPTQSISGWLRESFRFNDQKILVASKGIESSTGRFLNEIYTQIVPASNMCYLSGPSFAAEVIKKLPTALVISSENRECSEEFLPFFPSFMKVYLSNDVKGSEVAGAYKNVIAVAGGVCEGLGLGNNARAALITRGLAEMSRFGLNFGAKMETFMGLSGVGDLFLTATSEMSRNFRVGKMLSSGMKLSDILTTLGETAEGVETARAVTKISTQKNLYTPIANEVTALLDGKDPRESLARLLVSNKRDEF